MKHQTFTALAAATAVAFTLACSSQTGSPTSPNGLDPAGSAAYADGSTLKVTAPVAVSPAGGIEIDDTSPVLVINNSTPKFVQNLALSYVFEVLDAQNRVVYRSNPVAQGGGGRTSHEINLDLNSRRILYLAGARSLPDVHGPESGSGIVQDPESLWRLLCASPRLHRDRRMPLRPARRRRWNGSRRDDPVHARGCLRSEPRRIERQGRVWGPHQDRREQLPWLFVRHHLRRATAATRTSTTS